MAKFSIAVAYREFLWSFRDWSPIGRHTISTLLFAVLLAVEASAQTAENPVPFKPQQIDKIIVMDNMNRREADTLRFAAVAYTVHNGQALLKQKFDRSALLNGATPNSFYDSNLEFIVAGPNGITRPLDDIAARKAQQLDAFTLRGSAAERVADFSVGLMELYGSSRSARTSEGAVKLLYPQVKELAFALTDRDPRTPNLSREFAIEWATWAYNQVRLGTPEGLALAPYLAKYQGGVDPRKDNKNAAAVLDAAQRYLVVKSTKNSQEALAKLHKLEDVQTEIKTGVEQIHRQLAADHIRAQQAAAARAQLEQRVQAVQNVAGTLQITSYVFEIAGDKNAARTAAGLASAANGVANLVQNAATMAPMMLASGYVGVAIAVVSAIQSAKEPPNPYPAIFQMLAQISQQIDELRADVDNRLQALDAKTTAMLGQSIMIAKAIDYNVAELQKSVADLRNVLTNASSEMRLSIATTGDLMLRAEDRHCFQWTGERKLLPLKRNEFINCRDAYIDRSQLDASSNLGAARTASIATSLLPASELFPFAESYSALALKVGTTGLSKAPVNPTQWFRSATFLVELIRRNPEHFNDVIPEFLDPVIQAGEDISTFRSSIATNKDGALDLETFTKLLDQLYQAQRSMVGITLKRLQVAPIKADVAAGERQEPNRDFPYQMLATNGVSFCEKAQLELKTLENVSLTWSGGRNGIDEIANQTTLNQTPQNQALKWAWVENRDLRKKVEAGLRTFDFKKIKFDKSLIGAIDRSVVLAEQTAYKNARMSMCVSRFDFDRINMTPQTEIQADLTLGLRIFLTIEGAKGNTTFLVQELAGPVQTAVKFYYFYRDRQPRASPMIDYVWAKMQGRFDRLLSPQTNSEADENLKMLQAEMKAFFADNQGAMYQSVLAIAQPQMENYQSLTNQLRAISKIGLNQDHSAVQNWIAILSNGKTFVALDTLIQQLVLQAEPSDNVLTRVDNNFKEISDALTELATYQDLKPPSDGISVRINELKKIKVMRSSLSHARTISGNRSPRPG